MRRSSSLLAALCALASLPACRREAAGQTAILITLDAKGPCDCVTIREEAAGEGGLDAGTVLTQQIDAAAGLPAELTTSPGWRTAKLSALVYSGGALGNGAVVLVAEGHRGSCSGPVVSRFSAPSA